ncbi:elongation factor G [Paenibacillus aceti]|nr:TetM/TetW/TetO/TetS family tetracycline resistance ribosomal protection protein [Paenibacillus aceti]
MNKTIGLLAHVDAGKTTFAEQLLYHTNSIRSKGRVDHQDSFLDTHELEKSRGITIFADQAMMNYQGSTYYLIDTPGHVDFSAEMERSLQVMDYAVVILSAVEGVQGHTETVWQLLRKHSIPTLFFVNKMDRTGADLQAVLEQIHQQLTPHAVMVHGELYANELEEGLVASIAEHDEQLLESYLEGSYDTEIVLNTMARLVKDSAVFPVMYGSALMDEGIDRFLRHLERLSHIEYDREAPFAARVYKVRHESQGTRLTFLKITAGRLRVRDEVQYMDHSGERIQEKVTSLRSYNGEKYTLIEEAEAGQLIAVTGLAEAAVGDGLGELRHRARYELVPALKSRVLFDPKLSVREVQRYFQMLDAEDPSLNVTWDEVLQELYIHVMGAIQLEVLEQVVLDRFKLQVAFGTPEILYKETIAGEVYGCGHFEPLGHYAEVHLKLEPGPRDSGVIFRNECHPDHLSSGYQNLVGQHVLEQEHPGLLTGSPLTDVIVTLLNGRAHNKHTSGGDFREATHRALRQGLEKAENILLEPYYMFKIKVDLELIGRVMSDIRQAHGSFNPPETSGDQAMISGTVPVATFMNYSAELASFSKGRGALSLQIGGYQPCHQSKVVIESRNYDKNADPEYTSASIFCAKGQGYSVPWDEADRHMHVQL